MNKYGFGEEKYYVTPLCNPKVGNDELAVTVGRRCNMYATSERFSFPISPERFVELAANDVHNGHNMRIMDSRDHQDPEYRACVDSAYRQLVKLVGAVNVSKPTYGSIFNNLTFTAIVDKSAGEPDVKL